MKASLLALCAALALLPSCSDQSEVEALREENARLKQDVAHYESRIEVLEETISVTQDTIDTLAPMIRLDTTKRGQSAE